MNPRIDAPVGAGAGGPAPRSRHRRGLSRRGLVLLATGVAVGGSVLALVGSSLVDASADIEAQRSCVVDYTLQHQWATGFAAQVTVANTGESAVDDWALRWTLPAGSRLLSGTEGAVEQRGGAVTIRPDGRSGTLRAGQRATVRLVGTRTGRGADTPTEFTVNGVPCSIANPATSLAGPGVPNGTNPSGVAAARVPVAKPGSVAGSGSRPGAAGPLGRLFVDPEGQVYDWLRGNGGDSRATTIRSRIGAQPQARWFTEYNPGSIEGQVRAYTSAAAAAGRTAVFVAYSMTHRDCNGASAGGAPDADGYRTWIRNLAAGIGGRKAIVVLEPDAIPHLTDCLSGDQQEERLGLLRYAGQVLNSAAPNARIYYDVGNSSWLPAADVASRAKRAGAAQYGDGIALNTSNFNTTASEVAYGKRVLAGLGNGLQMVVDTSRNGAGPAGGEWCDPGGRKLGRNPTTATGDPAVAAFLWVKRPGEADGCAAAAGQFSADTAYQLSS